MTALLACITSCGLVYAATRLPDGSTLTEGNIDSYKSSSTYQDLTIREGAKMSDAMNYDDCHDPSYSLCIDWGPCEVSVFGVDIEVPSFGLEFEYWEPNALVETVCSEGNSYYEDEMNITSRMIGQERILGDETEIAGLPAEKCIETIKTGGGMEGSGAMPRYFNEVHIWGVGIIPRFLSSASTMEALVSSICGYAEIGGMFEEFSFMKGDQNIDDFDSMSNEEIQAYSETQGVDWDGIGTSAQGSDSWFRDSYDQFTGENAAGGMGGMSGLEMIDNMNTAFAIGGAALGAMQSKSSDEVRADKLCKERQSIREARDKARELYDIASAPDFDFDAFVNGVKMTDGVCPIGVSAGHTLTRDPESFRGVREVPFWPNMCDGWKDEDCNRNPPDTSTRVSQMEISGMFPACDGLLPAGTVVQPGMSYSYDKDGNIESSAPTGTYTYGGANIPASVVGCITTTPSKFAEDNGETSQYICSLTTNYTVQDPILNHRKALNDYMSTALLENYEQALADTQSALQAVNQRINDLNGDCDSSGKPVGVWGDAVMGAALGILASEGIQAAQDYFATDASAQALSSEAPDYTQGMTNDMMGMAGDQIMASEFMEQGLQEYLPQIMDEVGFADTVSGMGGMAGQNNEYMDYFQMGMDVLKAATYDGAVQQAIVGSVTSNDPTGLWPGFMSEMSALSWRGKDIPKTAEIRGMIGTVGHLPCAIGSIGTDIGLGGMGNGSMLAATEDWLGCVGTWGPLEPQNGFVYHRDAKIAAALAGYRAYKMAVSLRTIEDHDAEASGRPMKINMDFPHQTDCFVPGTADLRWESKHGFDVQTAIAQAYTGTLDYLMAPFQNMVTAGSNFDASGNRTAESKQMETEEEGHVFTYWRKSKCCLYLVEYYYVWRPCWEVEREY
jgi:hypothetical protein